MTLADAGVVLREKGLREGCHSQLVAHSYKQEKQELPLVCSKHEASLVDLSGEPAVMVIRKVLDAGSCS